MIELLLNDTNTNLLGSKHGPHEGRFYIPGGSDSFDGHVQSGGVGLPLHTTPPLVNLKPGTHMYCVKSHLESMQGYIFFFKTFTKKMPFSGLVSSYFREYKT